MRGSYFCVAEDGERFDVQIPPFIMDAEGGGAGTDGATAGRVLH